jgi:hypothetical protein
MKKTTVARAPICKAVRSVPFPKTSVMVSNLDLSLSPRKSNNYWTCLRLGQPTELETLRAMDRSVMVFVNFVAAATTAPLTTAGAVPTATAPVTSPTTVRLVVPQAASPSAAIMGEIRSRGWVVHRKKRGS